MWIRKVKAPNTGPQLRQGRNGSLVATSVAGRRWDSRMVSLARFLGFR